MAKLIANVWVDGVCYGPDGEQDVPPEVAERIGEHAWEDGKKPHETKPARGNQAAQATQAR